MEGEWPASRHFIPRERACVAHWIGGWGGPQNRVGRGSAEKNLDSAGIRNKTSNPSLYRPSYGRDDSNRGSIADRENSWLFSPQPPDRPRGPPSLLFKCYRCLYPREQSGLGVRLSTHYHLVSRLEVRGVILPLPYTSLPRDH